VISDGKSVNDHKLLGGLNSIQALDRDFVFVSRTSGASEFKSWQMVSGGVVVRKRK